MRRDEYIVANPIPNVTMKDVEEIMKGHYTFWPQHITVLIFSSLLFVMPAILEFFSMIEALASFILFSILFTYNMRRIWEKNFEKAKQEKLKQWNDNIDRRNELARKSVEARSKK